MRKQTAVHCSFFLFSDSKKNTVWFVCFTKNRRSCCALNVSSLIVLVTASVTTNFVRDNLLCPPYPPLPNSPLLLFIPFVYAFTKYATAKKGTRTFTEYLKTPISIQIVFSSFSRDIIYVGCL